MSVALGIVGALYRGQGFYRRIALPALQSAHCLHTSQRHSKRYTADTGLYQQVYERARDKPDEFWAEQAQGIDWFKKWDTVLDNSKQPFTKWFSGGELNVCHNAVDRHVEAGNGEQVAIIYDSPMTDVIQKITYNQLLDEVSRLAGVYAKHGVTKGDRVLIYMPMIPQAMAAMLASARLGAIHSVVFGGFASKELAIRINNCQPKVIVSSNFGFEPGRSVPYKPLLDKAIELSQFKPPACIIYKRQSEKVLQMSVSAINQSFQAPEEHIMIRGRDWDYCEEMAGAPPQDCVPVDAMHPLYILYTSGTTGNPKAAVRPSGGHAVVLNWTMWNVYGMKPKEVWFAGSELGWSVGHSYITYAPLIHGNPTVLFEGKPIGTPDPGTYFRILQDHKVAGMFVVPNSIRALRRQDPAGDYAKKYSYPDFRYLFVAGEHCDRKTQEWAQKVFNTPVLDNWWQAETGSTMTSTCVGLGNDLYPPAGVAGQPVPGWNVQLLPHGSDHADDEIKAIVVKCPLPPGSFSTLYNDDDRYTDLYFSKYPGFYDTMDSGFIDDDGNVAVMTRSDDVINVAGHRLSTGQLEEAILEHEDVVEAAVVEKADKLKGHVPLGIIVLKTGMTKSEDVLRQEVIDTVRQHVGPVASFNDVVHVPELPKTRSGKVARGTIAAMVAGKPYKIPVTIEDASVYPRLIEAFRREGYTPSVPTQ